MVCCVLCHLHGRNFRLKLPIIVCVHDREVAVQAHVAPVWEYVLQPLTEAGVYKGVFADIPMTQAALYSDRTAAVHLTGSSRTYDAVLFGSGVHSPSSFIL